MDYKKQIRELLNELKTDKYKEYNKDWQMEAMALINEIKSERGDYDDYIYDLSSEEWDDICEHQIKDGGWLRFKYFIDGVENTSEFACIDVYGNAKSCDYDFASMLEDLLEEL